MTEERIIGNIYVYDFELSEKEDMRGFDAKECQITTSWEMNENGKRNWQFVECECPMRMTIVGEMKQMNKCGDLNVNIFPVVEGFV